MGSFGLQGLVGVVALVAIGVASVAGVLGTDVRLARQLGWRLVLDGGVVTRGR